MSALCGPPESAASDSVFPLATACYSGLMAQRAKPAAKAGTSKRSSKKAVAAAKDETKLELEPDEADGAQRSGRGRTNTAAGDEIGAAELANRVGEALRRFRRDRQLSFDELSARSGVSRAALSQIEGGRTNPTLAVLWKIAVGLDVPFHDLLGTNKEETVLVLRAGDALPLRSSDGRTESRLLSPGGSTTSTDVYELRLAPKALHRSDPHARAPPKPWSCSPARCGSLSETKLTIFRSATRSSFAPTWSIRTRIAPRARRAW